LSENDHDVSNYNHSRTCVHNLVNFDSRMAKNRTRVLIQPAGGHHAGLCQMPSMLVLTLH